MINEIETEMLNMRPCERAQISNAVEERIAMAFGGKKNTRKKNMQKQQSQQ